MLHSAQPKTKYSVSELKAGERASNNLVKNNEKLTNYVYTNVTVTNKTSEIKLCEINNTQDIPILGDQQDYMMKVARLKIPMDSVPLFQYKQGKYWVSIGYKVYVDPATSGDYNTRQFDDNFVNMTVPIEVPFIPSLDIDLEARAFGRPFDFAVYNEADFIRMVNVAVRNAWAGFSTIMPTELINEGWLLQPEPYFEYDCAINCIRFNAPAIPSSTSYPTIWYPNDCGGIFNGKIECYLLMSSDLTTFFNGFQYRQFGQNGVFDVTNATRYTNLNNAFYFNTSQTNSIQESQYGNCASQYFNKVDQTTSSLYAFKQVNRIFITTNIALVKESVLTTDDIGGNPTRLEVLTDFEIPQDGTNHNQYIYYFGDDSDRWHNIKDSGPLYNIDLKAFIQWQDGTKTPLFISPNHEFNIKLQWMRKNANDQYQITDKNPVSRSTF